MPSNPYRPPASFEPPTFVDQGVRLQRLAQLRDAFVVTNLGYAVVLTLPFFSLTVLPQAWAVLLASILEALTFAGFGGVLLVFLVVAHRNATAIKGAELRVSSAVLVGCFLVPIANLLLPFLVVRSLWHASAAPGEPRSSTPESFKNWWALWVASFGFATAWRWLISGYVSGNADGELFLSWCATLASAFAAVAVLRFVRELDARQRAAWRSRSS